MAAIKKVQVLGGTFKNEKAIVRARYEFAQDAGALGVLDIFQASRDVIITGFSAVVKTAGTSGGSATVKVGITGDDDLFLNTTQGAVANLTANAVLLPPVVEGAPNVLALPVKLAAGAKVLQTIGVAALTAGDIEYTIEYYQA